MPLLHSKSKKAFSKNVETEMRAGHPQGQSLAIAYSMKKRAKKMASGGLLSDDDKEALQNANDIANEYKIKDASKPRPPTNLRAHEVSGPEGDDYAKGGDTMNKKQRAFEAFHGKKMASGGPVEPIKDDRLQGASPKCDMCGEPHSNEEHENDRHDLVGEPMMAEGGQITDNYNSPSTAMNQTHQGNVDPQDTYTRDHEGNFIRVKKKAMSEDDRSLNQHGNQEEGEQGGDQGFHSGSYESNPGDEHDEYQNPNGMDSDDLISRIMKQRSYSRGGMVANEDSGESASIPDRMAKDKPNEMDDLALRDDLEFSYDDANSGDEDGDAREDMDRSDIISKVMKSRNKKAGSFPKSIRPGL